MFKKKQVVLHTSAEIDKVVDLLARKTAPGSPSPGHPVEMLKDSVRADDKPFRGVIDAGSFQLTRRVRGRKARVGVTGTLKPKPGGGTEIHATMAPPQAMVVAVYGGFVAMLVTAIGGSVAMGQPF